MANREREVRELREELATNVSNYEQQLSLMSEHLANMNDKLTAQTDEIDSLKHHNHYQRADSTGKGKKVKNK
ncbi:unnamed protein product [Oppiella nova]|uniref:Protein phosphatase 1 regulatory subunit 21 C-terminal domain-containing protein n=1 Tax=Oppiella nova TaxID=334625 RepID=A0A7R9M8K1_9ACAR|nr:unnamed protein product [Oppiella nova]CAD7662590.1 unnamed protein product [Oppiella nova]CAG2171491.1 unnamed protein product [Oppiella nova]CAG2179726.1 unnamed protein product [Oppiella nova]